MSHPCPSLCLAKKADITPYQQGALDSSCSLYAAINLIRLSTALRGSHYTLNKADERLIYLKGVKVLKKRDQAERALDGWGIGGKSWQRIIEAMAKKASKCTGLNYSVVWLRTPLSVNELKALLDQHIPVAINMQITAGGHYSLVSGYTSKTLKLFDSDGRCSLKNSSAIYPEPVQKHHSVYIKISSAPDR